MFSAGAGVFLAGAGAGAGAGGKKPGVCTALLWLPSLLPFIFLRHLGEVVREPFSLSDG